MYLTHFNLRQKPFEDTTDPQFFWFNENFAEAHAALEYGLQENKGFMLLTGSTGSGKTALLHAFIETIDPQVSVALIPDPDIDTLDFFNLLAMELGLQQTFSSKGEFLIFFKQFLQETISPGSGKMLIVIDEAQRAGNKLLTDMRLLGNLGTGDETVVNIILSGQPIMVEILAAPENASLKSRMAVDIRILPLGEVDTEKYIHYRLEKAGATEAIFTPDSVNAIFQFTRGNPLQINHLCDRTLLTAYTNNARAIYAVTVCECAEELGISLDTNTEIADDAIERVKSDDDSVSYTHPEISTRRSIKLFLIALVGVALAILLQISIFTGADTGQITTENQAFSTFESYRQQIDKSDSPEAISY